MRGVAILICLVFAFALFMSKMDLNYTISKSNFYPLFSTRNSTTGDGGSMNIKYGNSSNVSALESYDILTKNITTILDTEEENSCLSFSGRLWSQESNSVNWTDTVEMCHSILWPNSTADRDRGIEQGKDWTIPNAHTDESILELLSDCDQFMNMVPFPSQPASSEEADFPLAYVLVGARNAAQTVRFFRSIYQPQNAYCITYDNKSSETYKEVIQKLAGCFAGKNVYLTPEPENIHYAHYSILHSVMVCLRVLVERWAETGWRYVQITSWNDFPLRTNRELVRIFRIFNGSQDSALDPLMPHFFAFNHKYEMYELADIPRKTVPHGLTMYKGSYATSMSKEFVEFLFTNQVSRDLFKWMDGAWCPEEHYWQTIIHNNHLGAPGSFPGQCLHFYRERETRKPWVSRYQTWYWDPSDSCKGKLVSLSCVFGIADVPALIERPELIVHKIYEEFEPATAFCLEYWYWHRRCYSPFAIDESYYETFPSVRYQRLENKEEFVC